MLHEAVDSHRHNHKHGPVQFTTKYISMDWVTMKWLLYEH